MPVASSVILGFWPSNLPDPLAMKSLTMIYPKPLSLLLLVGFVASLASGLLGSPQQAVGQRVVFQTNLGNIEVQLHPQDAPIAVANFLSYVNAPQGSNYENTFFHRSVAGFIVQGGGFYVPVDGAVASVPQQAQIQNEFGISNTRGTLAFAKLGGDPDSATNQWFFNTADNSANLDNQNGGFTVFGSVVSGMDIVDMIQGLGAFDLDGIGSTLFDNVPLITVDPLELVVLNDVVLLGDMNLDGEVDFFDIAGFISVLAASSFQAEADIDVNDEVDFFDIAPFIDLLSQ